jgi:chromosome segregation ATPase
MLYPNISDLATVCRIISEDTRSIEKLTDRIKDHSDVTYEDICDQLSHMELNAGELRRHANSLRESVNNLRSWTFRLEDQLKKTKKLEKKSL